MLTALAFRLVVSVTQELKRCVLRKLWRYPIASMAGEALTTVRIDTTGMIGDRQFSLICVATGEVAAPESSVRWRPAPLVCARGTGLGLVIKTPRSDWLPALGTSGRAALNEHFGFEVGLKIMGAWRGEPTGSGVVRPRYPRAPLHVISRQMLARLRETLPRVELNAERFRANIVIDLNEAEEQEMLHPGATMDLGTVTIEIAEPTRRCAFVALAQAGLEPSSAALRLLKRDHDMNFGFYANVLRRGG